MTRRWHKNPEEPGKIYKINYSALSEVQSGSNALRQSEDFATVYDIHKVNHDGSKVVPVAQLPSELYTTLVHGFGHDITAIDFFARPSSPLIASTSLQYNQIKVTSMGGVLSDGSHVIAVGPSIGWGDPENDSAAGRSMIALIHKSPALGELLNMAMLLAVYTQYLNSRWLHFSDGLKTRFTSATTLHGAASMTYNGGETWSGYRSLGSQLSLVIKVTVDDRNQFEFKGFTGLAVGQRDARELYVPRVFHNLSVTQLTWTHSFKNVTLSPSIALGYREFGPQIELGLSCNIKPLKTDIKLAFQNALGPHNIGIAPGTTSLLYVKSESQVLPWIIIYKIQTNKKDLQ